MIQEVQDPKIMIKFCRVSCFFLFFSRFWFISRSLLVESSLWSLIIISNLVPNFNHRCNWINRNILNVPHHLDIAMFSIVLIFPIITLQYTNQYTNICVYPSSLPIGGFRYPTNQ
jgi:hypothetical protein